MEETKNKVQQITIYEQRKVSNLPQISIQKRVAAYCRVSSEKESQVSSYELQVEHYTQFIQKNNKWMFAGVYADYGKSGTTTKSRVEFLRMINDCKKGNIDLIITKSISRFARNTLDCLKYVRELQGLKQRVGIYFERENINTLDSKSELLLTILSSIAQDEARNISENLRWSIQKRYEAGKAKPLSKQFLGYEYDTSGNLIINEKEAETVRRIYKEYMMGTSPCKIALELKAEGVKKGTGDTRWIGASVAGMLRNEKYCGDILMQKTYTYDYLTHKVKKNEGERPQYLIENHHPAIIPKEDWSTTQAEIKRRYINYTSVISYHLFCGQCGQLYIKSSWKSNTVERERNSAWRCRATWLKNCQKPGDERCHEKGQSDVKVKKAFMNMLIKLKEKSTELALNEENHRLIEILDPIEDGTEFKNEYFGELVSRGVVYEGKIEYTFKNGITCTSYIKPEKRHYNSTAKARKTKERGIINDNIQSITGKSN